MRPTRTRLSLALASGLGLFGCSLSQTTPFTDPATGINYQQTTQAQYSFGFVLPETPSADFIGRISVTNTQGWAGVSLAGQMRNSLMVVAWAHEGDIKTSLRYATGYSNPGVYVGTAKLKKIQAGTNVANGTAFTYTFLCEGCLATNGTTFDPGSSTAQLGYARSAAVVGSPASASSTLNFHSAGFGLYTADLAAARSNRFEEWAALAQDANETDPGEGGGPNPPSNGTVPILNSTFDYIVVGGGPAGLVSSQRLNEAGYSVLLIERGKASTASSGGTSFPPWNSSLTYYDVPGLFRALGSATLGEGYCTDTAAIAGCILGGGGSVNGLAFIHPPASDFERWPEGWQWPDISEAASRLYARNPGTTLPSRDGKYYDDETFDVLAPWFEAHGWNYADSIQLPDDKNKSFGHSAINADNGLRSGPIHTYLPLAQAKSNFELKLNTKVIRIVREGSKAIGVEVETSQGRQIIMLTSNSGGGIVLAAGVMSTPRVLFNSGIGPAEQITIVKAGSTGVTLPPESDWIDLPVGRGVMDHARLSLDFNVTRPGGLTTYSETQLSNPSEADKELYRTASGVLTQSFQRMDFFRTVTTSSGRRVSFEAHCNSVKNDTVTMLLLISHGLTSTGTLGITPEGSTLFAPGDEPWTHTDTDREAWTLVVSEILEMARDPASPVVYVTGADITAEDILAGGVLPGIHMTRSARIGTDDGRLGGEAVVDLDNKVYGTDNVFVVDASFHPDVPTGNTQAIVMIGAEHAVKRILRARAKMN